MFGTFLFWLVDESTNTIFGCCRMLCGCGKLFFRSIFERFFDDHYRYMPRLSEVCNSANVKQFCKSIGVFSACIRAGLGMKCAIEVAGSPDDVSHRETYSEAERASQRMNPIILYT